MVLACTLWEQLHDTATNYIIMMTELLVERDQRRILPHRSRRILAIYLNYILYLKQCSPALKLKNINGHTVLQYARKVYPSIVILPQLLHENACLSSGHRDAYFLQQCKWWALCGSYHKDQLERCLKFIDKKMILILVETLKSGKLVITQHFISR